MTQLGDTITDFIYVRNGLGVGVSGLDSGDFTTLTAFLVTDAGETAAITLEDAGAGGYTLSFEPTITGEWILDFNVTAGSPVATTADTRRYEVGRTIVAPGGGTWTYAADFTLQRDRIRRLIPDVDPDNPLMSDQDMTLFLTTDSASRTQDYFVAAMVCEALADGMPDMSAETTSVKLHQTSEFWLEKARRFRSGAGRLAASGAAPYAGGISRSDVDTRNEDFDRQPLRLEPDPALRLNRRREWETSW